jgi:glycerol-3-phosphate acyltransferase PlsY
LRTGNKKAALYTLLGDSLKGFVAVVIANKLFAGHTDQSWVLPSVMIAVFLGHVLPIFHRFHGGKGVATAAGILIGVNGILGLATMATWLIVAFFFRYSSLAALSAAAFAPFYAFLLFGFQPICGAILLIGAVLIWRHRQNIKNLIAGTETKIGSKKK